MGMDDDHEAEGVAFLSEQFMPNWLGTSVSNELSYSVFNT